MSKFKEATAKVWPVVRSVLTHKATYSFLLVLLGALGYSKAPGLVDTLQALSTALFGPLQ
ncbi:MAG: hypothetical protein EOM68_00030 [Spirochaetia bacterium]|nr:hypothetical protein [Spirochaetia bacterium]